jgi:hypothetical protein
LGTPYTFFQYTIILLYIFGKDCHIGILCSPPSGDSGAAASVGVFLGPLRGPLAWASSGVFLGFIVEDIPGSSGDSARILSIYIVYIYIIVYYMINEKWVGYYANRSYRYSMLTPFGASGEGLLRGLSRVYCRGYSGVFWGLCKNSFNILLLFLLYILVYYMINEKWVRYCVNRSYNRFLYYMNI